MHFLRLLLSKPPTPNPPFQIAHFGNSFASTKIPKKYKKKRKKPESARTKLVTRKFKSIPHFENLLHRDTHFRFLIRSKQFISKQTDQNILINKCPRLYQSLGFPRGRNVKKSMEKHPLLYECFRHDYDRIFLGFTSLMERLLEEEKRVVEKMEGERVNVIRKLLMMSKDKRIGLTKIYHNRMLFGIGENFRDRIFEYPEYFRVVEEKGMQIIELVKWDAGLAVSALEREFMVDEEKVKNTFRFPFLKRGEALELVEDEEGNLTMAKTLPLVSPYSDGSKLDLGTLDAEKYRVGLIHEFLSLTLEKRAYIHNIAEFKDEFCLTKHTYPMLKKQPQTFYLAGTEMNWCVFLKDGYDKDGNLIHKDPFVLFYEKLFKYADMKELEPGDEIDSESESESE